MVVSKRTVLTNMKRDFNESLKMILTSFLEENNTVTFNAIAFEVDAKTGIILISLNTHFDYSKCIFQYEKGIVNASINVENLEERIARTTDIWHYQAVGSMEIINEECYDFYYSTNFSKYIQFLSEQMILFKNTELYKSISRSDDFKIYLIDDYNIEKVYENLCLDALPVTTKNTVVF